MTLKQFKKLNYKQLKKHAKKIPFGYTYDKYGYVSTHKTESEFWSEMEHNQNGNLLTFKDRSGYWMEATYNKYGDELSFRNSNDDYLIKKRYVSKKEYDKFIKENK